MKNRAPVPCFLLTIVFMACPLFSGPMRAETIEPGKQVVRSAQLPASMEYHEQRTKQQRDAERARIAALTPEQRAEDRKQREDRRRADFKHVKPLHPTDKQKVDYWLFLPKDYDSSSDKQYPLLLFLHGSGERGSDPDKVKKHGPPKLLDEPDRAASWPFITVSPQCPDDRRWSPLQLVRLLDEIEQKYKVDRDRIYVTGLSMGGNGTWSLLYHFGDRFAAGAPVCGFCDPQVGGALVGIPLRVFHGARDEIVLPESSTETVRAIRQAGGERVDLTMYPEAAHDSWTETYGNSKLYDWFLEQKRPEWCKRPCGVVTLSAANGRAQPSDRAELTTQALLGTPVRIRDRGNWLFVETPEGYTSWMSRGSVTTMDRDQFDRWARSDKVIVTSHYGSALREAKLDARPVSDIVFGNLFQVMGEQGDFYKVVYPDGREAFIEKTRARPLDDWLGGITLDEASLVDKGYTLLGLPYFWGANTTKAVDCSGFVKMVFFMHGVILRRDSYQIVETGEPIDVASGLDLLRPGDLLFFRRESETGNKYRIRHIAMYIGNKEFLHAGNPVKVNSFDPQAANYDEYGHKTLIRATRILGRVDTPGISTIRSNSFYKPFP